MLFSLFFGAMRAVDIPLLKHTTWTWTWKPYHKDLWLVKLTRFSINFVISTPLLRRSDTMTMTMGICKLKSDTMLQWKLKFATVIRIDYRISLLSELESASDFFLFQCLRKFHPPTTTPVAAPTKFRTDSSMIGKSTFQRFILIFKISTVQLQIRYCT